MATIAQALVLSVTSFLAGCIAPGTNLSNVVLPQVADAADIALDTCYVVTRINVRERGPSIRALAYLSIRSDSAVGSFYNAGQFAVPSGSEFHVVAFRPGRYAWRELNIDGHYGIFKDSFSFQCPERQVTYIGDVDLNIDWTTKRYGISFANRFEKAASDYAAQYPKLIAKFPLKEGVVQDSRQSTSQGPTFGEHVRLHQVEVVGAL
jgi:hypothetical protein